MKTTLIYDQNGLILVCATFVGDKAHEKAHLFGSANAADKNWIVIDGALEGETSSYCVKNEKIISAPQKNIVDNQWSNIRYKRFVLLSESDWRVAQAIETGIPLSEEWRKYRQALRDVTLQPDPFNIVWPIKPE